MFNFNYDEFNDAELDKKIEEYEKNLKFIDTAFEWLDLHHKFIPILQNFINNTEGISDVIEHLPNKDDSKHQFLIGTLLNGVTSAYEGMVHDFVHLLMTNSNYRKEDNTEKIQEKDLKSLNIKKNLPWDELSKRLKKSTLNHPNIVARIINALFELNIPEGDEEEIQYQIEMRNDFTHNNGINKAGTTHKVSWKYLEDFLTRIHKLVSNYAVSLQSDADKFLKDAPA